MSTPTPLEKAKSGFISEAEELSNKVSELNKNQSFKKWGALKIKMNSNEVNNLKNKYIDLKKRFQVMKGRLKKAVENAKLPEKPDWIKELEESLQNSEDALDGLIELADDKLKDKSLEEEPVEAVAEVKELDEKGRIEKLQQSFERLDRDREKLKHLSDESFSTYRDRVENLVIRVDNFLSEYGEKKPRGDKIPDALIQLAIELDNLSSYIIKVDKEKNLGARAFYAIFGTPTPRLGGKYLSKSNSDRFKENYNKALQAIQTKWDKDINKAFKADSDATPMTKAGVEGRRWGTTYLLTVEQEKALRSKKEAYDKIQATLTACRESGIPEKEVYEYTKYIVKATLSTAQEFVEQSVVTTGQAVMVGLGGPAYAAFILAWNAAFAVLEKGGNLFSGGFARLDTFAEESIMKIGKVAKNADGTFDWSSGGKIAKNIGLGLLHSLRVVSWLPKVLTSGIAAGTRAVNDAIGDFTKKHIIPLLGIGGTVIAAYFLAITLVSVFTFGAPLAITVAGLAAAVIGAGIATYMRTKSKAQEAINLKLSPEEEAMLMRYDYQQKLKEKQQNAPEIVATGAQVHAGSELKGKLEAVRVAADEVAAKLPAAELPKREGDKPASSEALGEREPAKSQSSPSPVVFKKKSENEDEEEDEEEGEGNKPKAEP